jgi:hypothetical protein
MIDILFSLCSVGTGMLAQACCWWHCFRFCGCIEDDREIIHTEQPQRVVVLVTPPTPINNNPFTNPSLPKDSHLQSAYL